MSRVSGRRVVTSAGLVARDLSRNRVAAALLLLVPSVFFVVVFYTTGHRPIDFQLSALGRDILSADERDLSMLFIGMASVSGVAVFLAFILVLRPSSVDRRLTFEGFRPIELLLAKLAVVVGSSIVASLWVTTLLPLFFGPPVPPAVFAGLALTSVVYGILGMAIGALARHELEGILFVLLLVNVDAGWLQNPVFYGHAQNQGLIRLLPGHHPGQVSMLSAFTDASILVEMAWSLLYAVGLLMVAAIFYWRRVRIAR